MTVFKSFLSANMMPTFLKLSLTILLLFSVNIILNKAVASEVIEKQEKNQDSVAYSKKGADTCLKCHDEDNDYPIMAIFSTKHGHSKNTSAPFTQKQCESCHGPGALHSKQAKKDITSGNIINFSINSKTPVAEQNKACLSCHKGDERSHWQGSDHESADVPCGSCHVMHVKNDPVLSKLTQASVCLSCHKKQRSEIHKRSSHPIKSKQQTCTDCHQPHGSVADHLLVKPTLNQTCFTCHAEKRGPVLFQHEPVEDNCANCHVAHGSNHKALLKTRTQLICRQCHSAAGHPSLAPSGTALPGNRHRALGRFSVGKECLNCHVKIHGSNHPSGSKLLR